MLHLSLSYNSNLEDIIKKTLIINGHPDKDSFNHALANSYKKGLEKSNAITDQINLIDLDFDPILKFGYRKRMELEPDLLNALEKIKNADHLVWVFPVWWCGYPAILKGFIDRTFLPGITFQPIKGKPFPKKLLKGKTARLIITSDTPSWYDYLFMKRPTINQFKKGVLEFCGISPVKVTFLSVIKDSSDNQRNKWLDKVFELGVHMN
ncbi:Putative NADPH-quinone reductase (modulator of drug activity B) [Tenacibaculum sp. MAR_2009_124]|uniref:NAD(P)H-dependent oxidoreductase n=1 Tax=Tenacibaculum sp. MAR_2009_124 TaxID=1250059 RepID=UPI00089A7142|nr:NAD(P)H-dependent oxidoreductase [Tenacibaculum sp. MAR_2009_124]SED14753.1 Putative NADPH-quinone reductase (modulator of drug activity B) [Tenacibaculum sp. MAR_2009_124]